MMSEMGDTAVEWAMGAAEMAYFTNAFSPRSERMRSDIVKASFEIVKKHYQSSLQWEDYWRIVVQEINKLQEKDKQNYLRNKRPIPEPGEDLCTRSIESLFDINRQDKTSSVLSK